MMVNILNRVNYSKILLSLLFTSGFASAEWLCCVIQFRDRVTLFRMLFSQYDKFQAYLTQ
ncbi:hypothetical protein F7Q91_24980 [Vibrio chagasii]|uniref:Uncharacterized protein n=1 Tax=Vibrio chagasii TaxID=170679 RepID=A0A7V7NP87_9VIBR|nr:hypothetical protein F7Q91_24980 [Vibrio chagasii]